MSFFRKKGTHMEKKKKKNNLKPLLIILLLVLCTVLLAAVYVSPTIAAMKYYKSVAKDKVSAAKDRFTAVAVGSVAFDKDDKEFIRFRSDGDMSYITASNMTDAIKYAFVVLEDEKFFDNKGAKDKDLYAVTYNEEKAVNLVPGISMITRGIAKDFVIEDDVDMNNSLLEVYVANELEHVYSKDELLEYYINNIYFGNGVYGAQSASKYYFKKELQEIAPSELAFLAALASNPEMDPSVMEDLEVITVKKNAALDRMYDAEVITREEYFKAISDSIVFAERGNIRYNYIEKFVLNDAIHNLMENEGFVFRYTFDDEKQRDEYEKKYKELYAKYEKDIYRKGYKIYTSIDIELVEVLQSEMDKIASASPIKNGDSHALTGGAVVLDNKTGKVIALTGGESVDSDTYVYNRAYESDVALGRTVWPMDIYIPYIEWHHDPGYIVYAKQAVDGTLIDKVTLREAIASYSSDFAGRMYEKIGGHYAMSLLLRTGFNSAANYKTATPRLGYITGNMLELAGAYMAIAEDGTYRKPSSIRSIADKGGISFLVPADERADIYAANDDRIMVDILADNMKEGGYLNRFASDSYASAAFSDGGIVAGFSTYYTVAVYNAFEGISTADMPEESKVDHLGLSGTLYKNVMDYLHKDKEKVEFEKPGPYSKEDAPADKALEPTTERPSLGGEGGHPGDGDDRLNNNLNDYHR